MSDLSFDCVRIRPEPYAAAPTLLFRLRIDDRSGGEVRAIALRCQLRIQPHLRPYSPEEGERLADLFGEPSRWPTTLRPLQLATVTAMVPGFRGGTEIDVPVPCSYDLEVSCGQYFHALDDGEVPLLLLFSGTVFTREGVAMVPWERECAVGLPAGVWRDLMDRHFPGCGWLRLRRETLDALQSFKHARQLATWEETVGALLDRAGGTPGPAPGGAPGRAPWRAGDGDGEGSARER
ncbi:DUF6084 family protein [Streptomyces sp. NPDC003077]|uniref:DUF6084 family protein n=1 Tax=Streptomyces sp. NPDC003077 TaxID=3154443 RepID=UPI0033B50EEB